MSLPEFFFDRVSAEIRQQMDGILALADQLARQRLPADAEACVASVAEAAAGVRRTLDSALDLKAVATQGLSLAAEPIRLRELTDTVLERWQGRAAQAGVTLLGSYDGDPDAVALGDRPRLLQVFDGLVGEAVAGAGHGAIEVSLRAVSDGPTLRLEGRVRGPRTAAWDNQTIEARVRDVATRFGLEVAIGTMLARRIITASQGQVREASESGSVAFELALPKAVEASAKASPLTERPAHILIVDDNATNRVVAQALCEMMQCTTETANDGFEAVEAAKAGRFDLILMDIRMPGMDGVEATRAIRGLGGAAGDTPIIALTANVDPEEIDGYVRAGMLSVIEKPMKAEHLRKALAQALGAADGVRVA